MYKETRERELRPQRAITVNYEKVILTIMSINHFPDIFLIDFHAIVHGACWPNLLY